MKVSFVKKKRNDLPQDTIRIYVEYNAETQEVSRFTDYIEKYDRKSIFIQDNFILREVFYKDIICFFSEEKYNYCQTLEGIYKIKSRLYEIEKLSIDFMRISKNCIINIEHIKNFDISKTGKIKINLDNDTYQLVSRRKIRDVLDFLNERTI